MSRTIQRGDAAGNATYSDMAPKKNRMVAGWSVYRGSATVAGKAISRRTSSGSRSKATRRS